MLSRAVFLCIALAGTGLAASSSKKKDPAPAPRDGYRATNAEAQAIMGELKFQQGDLSGARRTYQKSLETGAAGSVRDDVAAIDHYRTAEIALHSGEYAEARRHLQFLLQRYSSSEWAEKAQRLIDSIPGGEVPTLEAQADAPFVPAMPSATPEEALARLRADIEGHRDDEALGEAYDFLQRYRSDERRYEVGLAAGALHLRRAEPARAIRFLKPLIQGGRDVRLQGRAIHLLGAALFSMGRDRDVLKVVPPADPAGGVERWIALAQIWRAASLDRLGRREEAAELYRAVSASGIASPVRAYALAAIAADWDRHGKPQRAKDALARAEEESQRWKLSGLRDALALAGATEMSRARRYDEAAKDYARFVARYPDSPLAAQALYERGLALKRLDDKSEAARSFESLLDGHPDSAYAADAHLQLGQIYAEMGKTEQALAHYRKMGKSSEAKDADREALLLMAQVHYNAKRWKEAIPLYRRYLESSPDDAKARSVRGLLLACLWQTDREDPELLELAAKVPEHPLVAQIGWELAAKAYKRGDWAAAESLFKRRIEADPRSPRTGDARFYSAEALRQMGKTPDAIDAYRRFLSAHPGHPRKREAAMRLGALLFANGDSAGAASAYARVTGTDADAADAAYNRALALAKAGKDSPKAWEDFAARFPRHPQASHAWWDAARLHEERAASAAAAKDYEKARGPGERTRSLYALGRLREKLKQISAAKAAYQELVTALPKNDPARLAGILRLALLLELEEKPRAAAPLYGDILHHANRSSATFETARKRLESLTKGGVRPSVPLKTRQGYLKN